VNTEIDMPTPASTICSPDLSTRPFHLTVERSMAASPEALYRAWSSAIPTTADS
jgi:hypothetical protein